jgi:hypothetical protein
VGQREVIIKESVADSVAEIAWYIESKGLVKTAEKFADDIYDFFIKLADSRRSHPTCRDPERSIIGYKCIPYKRKYTIVFLESADELIICEFIPSKNIHW